ncbi:MAG: hypothetical protein GX288_03120 [Clostridiales bacterium]|nr:hypothetical protein [Clostridiales bacterium]
MRRIHKLLRLLLLTVIVISTLLLNGCNPIAVVNNEEKTTFKLEDNMLVLNSAYKISDEKDLLISMDKVLENEYLELYIGEYYDIAVYNKSTGKVFWSNEVFYNTPEEERGKLIDESKRILFSQVGIEYYNWAQKKFTMTSYPDSYSNDKNQVFYEVVDDALIVRYGIGTNFAETGLVQAFTNETYSYYDAMLKEKIEAKEISIIDYRAFVNNYTELRYSAMTPSDKAEYLAKYPKLEELEVIYVLKPNLTNKITNQLLEMYSLMGIDDRVREAEEEKLGIVEGVGLPPYFLIPLRYRLHGNDLIVSVDTEDIEVAEGYYLTRVEILKAFGATTNDREGYIFLPDGSGSIIENGSRHVSMDRVSIPFYGQDYAKNYKTYDKLAIDSNFPVFGIKSGDNAVFAIVENGAAIGGVTAQITSNYMKYNIAYPYFDYTIVDGFGREGVAYAFYGVEPEVDYTIRYHFLQGEEANYSGMARYYRSYLLQRGYLSQDKASNELPLDIQFIGSINKTVNYVGLPIETTYPMTTFEEAGNIMNLLHDNSINNANVLYSGMVNGGLTFKSVSKVKVQKELGGVRGFQRLDSQLQSIGYEVYPDIDFTRIYEEGHGIKHKNDVSRYLNRNSAFMSDIDPASGEKTFFGASLLVNPLLYDEIVHNFLDHYKELKTDNIYVASMGAYLSGNYSSDAGVTRQTAYLLTKRLLDTLSSKGYSMKFDSGNDYILPYADSLTNVATSSSNQRIEAYSIPFVGMVLKGYLPYTCQSINQSSNSERAVLEAVESGAGLNYLLMHEDQLSLVDTDQINLFSVDYELWLEEIIRTYNQLNGDLGYLSNVEIREHRHLDDDINCVVYDDGSKVYVNYRDTSYETPDGLVEAMSYLVVQQRRGNNGK